MGTASLAKRKFPLLTEQNVSTASFRTFFGVSFRFIIFVAILIGLLTGLILWLSQRALERPTLCWYNAEGQRVEGDPLMHSKGDSPVFDCSVNIGTAARVERP